MVFTPWNLGLHVRVPSQVAKSLAKDTGKPVFTYYHKVSNTFVVAYWIQESKLMKELRAFPSLEAITRADIISIKKSLKYDPKKAQQQILDNERQQLLDLQADAEQHQDNKRDIAQTLGRQANRDHPWYGDTSKKRTFRFGTDKANRKVLKKLKPKHIKS